MSAGRRALFLDWGGTIVLTREHRTVLDADGQPVLMPNVAATVARERKRYDACFIVSNQARVSRGEISEAEVFRRFAAVADRLGHPFAGWRICPHTDEDRCACRKPSPAMFLDLAAAHGVDLRASLHVGDSEKDRQAALAAGIGEFRWAADFFGWRGASWSAG